MSTKKRTQKVYENTPCMSKNSFQKCLRIHTSNFQQGVVTQPRCKLVDIGNHKKHVFYISTGYKSIIESTMSRTLKNHSPVSADGFIHCDCWLLPLLSFLFPFSRSRVCNWFSSPSQIGQVDGDDFEQWCGQSDTSRTWSSLWNLQALRR